MNRGIVGLVLAGLLAAALPAAGAAGDPWAALGVTKTTRDILVRDNFIAGGQGNGITLGAVRGSEDSAALSEIDLERNYIRGAGESGIGTAAAARLTCVQFAAMAPGVGANPRTESGVAFRVRDFQGTSVAQSRIESWGGLTGLNCGFRTEIELPAPTPQVRVTLAHFSQPATVEAFNADGSSAGSATMSATQRQAETLSLTGTAIRRVVITAPQDETLLLELCFGAVPSNLRDNVVLGLRIRDNVIRDCVAANPPARADGLPYGGIVLGSVRDGAIRGNRIERNGARSQGPICGVFVRRSSGLDITGNRVVNNGTPPGSIRRRAGQGGIVALDVSASGGGSAAWDEATFAARVAGNLVVTPGTLALYLRGSGPQIVTDNRLVSQGNVGLSPDILGNLGQLASDIVAAPEVFVGSAVILNGGLDPVLGAYSAAYGYAAFPVNAAVAPGPLGAAAQLGGMVQFSDNQVVLDMAPGEQTVLPVGVAILTLGDLVMVGNQTESRLANSFQYYDTFATATTARAVSNGYTENPRQCAVSLALRGTLMSTGADNQATHCILVYGTPPRRVDRDNLSLLCHFGSVPILGRMATG